MKISNFSNSPIVWLVLLSCSVFQFCCNRISNSIEKNCFTIAEYPEFRMDEPIDTSRLPFDLMPFDDNDEPIKNILTYSKGFMCINFDEPISTLMFTLENGSNKLNSITAMWSVLKEPKVFLEDIKTKYLPCIPIEKLLSHPNVVFNDNSNGYKGSYKFSKSDDGFSTLHYWVNVNY